MIKRERRRVRGEREMLRRRERGKVVGGEMRRHDVFLSWYKKLFRERKSLKGSGEASERKWHPKRFPLKLFIFFSFSSLFFFSCCSHRLYFIHSLLMWRLKLVFDFNVNYYYFTFKKIINISVNMVVSLALRSPRGGILGLKSIDVYAIFYSAIFGMPLDFISWNV